jgi:TM2 domain-containing membrane protein YozV
MSVDISRLAAHLAPQQQETVRKEYRKRAWHDTTAFLLCFFGGIFGAHRFYLRQYAQGFLHLLFPVAALVVLVVGIAASLSPVIIVLLVVVLLLIGLIWSIIDLFRIDDQVYAHNLKLAEQLIAQVMLRDHAVEQAATARLDALRQEAAAASAGVAGAAATDIAYHATTVTQVSESPTEQERTAAREPQSWTQTEQVPSAGYGPPVQETVTRSHVETPESVTDSVETVRTVEPQVPASAPPDSTQPAPAPSYYDDLDPTTAPASAFPAPEPVASEAPTWPEHPPLEFEAPLAAAGAAGLAAAAAGAWREEPSPAPEPEPAPKTDYTDQGMADAAPVSDVAVAYGAPQHVFLPAEPAPAIEPAAATDEGLLVLAPDNITPAAPAPTAPSVWDLPTQRYEPPAAEPEAPAAAEPPLWPVPAPEPEPAAAWQPPAEPVTPDEPPTQPYDALAAGATGAALAGGVAAFEAERHAPAAPAETPAAPPPPAAQQPQADEPQREPHKLRRVRVTRQIVVDGNVVEETSAEELIPADADPEPVRQRLHDQLKAQAEVRERELRGQS